MTIGSIRPHLVCSGCSPVHGGWANRRTVLWCCHKLSLAQSLWGHRCMEHSLGTTRLIGHRWNQRENKTEFLRPAVHSRHIKRGRPSLPSLTTASYPGAVNCGCSSSCGHNRCTAGPPRPLDTDTVRSAGRSAPQAPCLQRHRHTAGSPGSCGAPGCGSRGHKYHRDDPRHAPERGRKDSEQGMDEDGREGG